MHSTQQGIRNNLPILRIVVGFILLLAPSLVMAKGNYPVQLPDDPGKWQPWQLTDLTKGFKPAEYGWTRQDVDRFVPKIKSIADEIRRADDEPKGVDRKITGCLNGHRNTKWAAKLPYRPVSGHLLFNAFDHFIGHDGKTRVGAEGPVISLNFNNLKAFTDNTRDIPEVAKLDPFDDGRGLYWEPIQTGEFQGFPVYDTDVVIMTRSRKPIWVPVTQERLLEILIRKAEKEEKTIRLTRDDEMRLSATAERKNDSRLLLAIPSEHVRMLKAELASLSDGERKEPAYVKSIDYFGGLSSRRPSGIVDADVNGARQLVSPNLDFFNTQLPKSAIQLVILHRYPSLKKYLEKERVSWVAEQRQVELVEAINWNELLDFDAGY